MSAEPTVAGGLEGSSLVELAVRRLRSEILSGAGRQRTGRADLGWLSQAGELLPTE